MRLTLRTLLAYLDDILEPADQEELKQKIEASEFATDLVHRTRDTMRRLRLSAPQVTGTGIGLDPNSVSEYLDNTLPPDSVADFERICLESEMHLAEVVSCHHVLTMVLGEPADVDSDSRQRMYEIIEENEKRRRHRLEPAHVAAEAVASVEASPPPVYEPVVVASYAPANDEEIPDYLRTNRWSLTRMGLVAAAVLLIAVAGYQLLVPPSAVTERELAQSESELGQPISPNLQVVDRPGEETDPADSNPVEPAEHTVGDDQAVSPGSPPELTAPSNVVPPVPAEGRGDNEITATEPIGPILEVPDAGSNTNATVSARPSGVIPPVNSMEEPGEMPVTGPGETVPADTSSESDLGSTVEPPMGAQLPTGPVAVAFYVGGDDVLAQFNPDEKAWYRLNRRSEIMEEGRLLTLPGYRSRISLPSGIDLALSGGTLIDVKLAPADALQPTASAPNRKSVVEVIYGRLLLVNPAAGELTIELVIGNTATEVRLAQNTTLAVDVERSFLRGEDPRETTMPVTARLIAMDGGVTWGEMVIAEPMQWTFAEGQVSEKTPLTTIPDWVDGNSSDRLEEMAARRVDEELSNNRPLAIQLQELFYEGRRAEDKALAARSSVYIGQFSPFVEALRDPEQRNAWNSLIQSLRDAMALSPESAEQVWKELVKQRGEDAAADLYEMLCGYSKEEIGETPEQIQSGVIPTLIDRLENDIPDYRVLAFYNLQEITGKSLAYVPTARAEVRQRSVRTWRQRLKDGELEPRTGE